MANPFRGEASFEAGGKTYTVHYGLNAFCEIEAQLGMPVAEALQTLDDGNARQFRSIRTVLCIGLQRAHPGISEADAAEIATACGLRPALVAMITALKAASQVDEGEGDRAENPPDPNGSSRSTG